METLSTPMYVTIMAQLAYINVVAYIYVPDTEIYTCEKLTLLMSIMLAIATEKTLAESWEEISKALS